MALILADRVRETSTTAGTGTITLTGAVTGFKSFSTIGNGNTTYYSIVDRVTNDWEVGVGTYTSSGTTLSRNTVLSNSLGTTALINFGANQKDVFVTYPADRSVYEQSDGSVMLAANTTSDALRITQTGSGNAFVVEDSTSPDSSPFVIDASGRVINGSTVAYSTALTGIANLQTHGTSITTAGVSQTSWVNSPTSQPSYSFNKSRGGIGTHTAVQDGDTIAAISFAGSDGTDFIRTAQIVSQVDGTPGTNDMPGRLVFSTTAAGAATPTERMRIDSAGNVGIGSTGLTGISLRIGKNITGLVSPFGVRVDGAIQTDVTASPVMFQSRPITAASVTATNLFHYSADPQVFGAGTTITTQYGFNASGSLTGATNNYGFYGNIASGTGRYNFYANGTADNYFAGNVGIGITSPSYKLHVDGDIYATGNVTAYSDRRLKDNIATLTNALATVEHLRGVSYTRKDSGEKQIGVIAQEVEQVVPEVVVCKDGHYGVAYGNLTALLIEAVKELSERVKILEKE